MIGSICRLAPFFDLDIFNFVSSERGLPIIDNERFAIVSEDCFLPVWANDIRNFDSTDRFFPVFDLDIFSIVSWDLGLDLQ